jgi:hypothetical protein
MNRRNFLRTTAASALASAGKLSLSAENDIEKFSEYFVPARAITKGPQVSLVWLLRQIAV